MTQPFSLSVCRSFVNEMNMMRMRMRMRVRTRMRMRMVYERNNSVALHYVDMNDSDCLDFYCYY